MMFKYVAALHHLPFILTVQFEVFGGQKFETNLEFEFFMHNQIRATERAQLKRPSSWTRLDLFLDSTKLGLGRPGLKVAVAAFATRHTVHYIHAAFSLGCCGGWRP
jgi:hypothetical protein